MKKFLTSICITTILLSLSQQALADSKKESNFYIKKGSQFQLCREIKQILDEPVNATFGDPYIKERMFKVPKKYKNFRFPKWQDVPIKDADKYISSKKVLDKVWNLNKNHHYDYVMQKSYLDLDHDGDNDEVVRYKIIGDSYPFKKDFWNHYVSDVEKKTAISIALNPWSNSPFWYKGKVFLLTSMSHIGFSIYEPKKLVSSGKFYKIYVCSMQIPISRIPEIIKLSKEDRKKEKEQRDKKLQKKTKHN